MNRTLIAMLVATVGMVGCIDVEGEPFDPEGNDDTTVESSEGKNDGTCKNLAVPQRAYGGTLLLPTGYKTGYVVVKDERIVSVVDTAAEVPAGTQIIETDAIISPGFIDLHNHVAYDFLPLWNSGKKWQNRYQWARAKDYDTYVKKPYNAVKAKHICEALKYGEFRAATGGTTSIQGSVDQKCARSWVRNVEFYNFCQDKVRQNVLAINSITPEEAAEINAQYTSGKTSAFLVHLAEGIDDSSRVEFEQLRALGLLKPQTVGIHSTALTDAQLQEMGQIGMKIVWSPLSNIMLYGKTTNVPVAVKAGVKVALAPDWAPSGSQNVLGELKIADRVNKEQWNRYLTDKQLWQMTTENPADIVGLGDKIGRIAPGYFADLVVIKGRRSRPYRTIIEATPDDVQLTLISGKPIYGTAPLLAAHDVTTFSTVDACGQPRGLVDQDPAQVQGTQTLNDVTTVFANDGVTNVIPLFQCGAPPDWAFPPATTPTAPPPPLERP